MKLLTTFIVAALAVTGAFAQTNENFNSRSESALTNLKSYLQGRCWQFPGFDVNNGWDPALEGDGALVSGTSAGSNQNCGIYSPLLGFNGTTIRVAFKYKFSAAVTDRRWLIISSTSGDNTLLNVLDSIELTGANNTAVYTYDKSLPAAGSGCYKIHINYRGIGGDTRIAFDDLQLGMAACFNGGCNEPPVAVNDFFGANRSLAATGNVLPNDSDPEGNQLTTQLVSNSPDGDVVLQGNGNFIFTPKANFTGQSTTFTYMVCDNGTPSMCSDVATVTVVFQAQGGLPVQLTDLGAVYANDKVNVKWTTTFELNNDHFDVERSTDGVNFTVAGTVKGQANSSVKHNYQFNDDLSKSFLNKNDVYYRLKQVDVDGKATLTKVLVVRVYRTKSLQSLSVTPNPAINDIKVNVQLNENAYIVMKIANSTGIELMRKTTRGTAGSNSFSMEGTSRLQPGVYFLEVIINSNERMNVKLIKN